MVKPTATPDNKSNLINLIFLLVFGVAFGFVVAAVVYYLRDLMNFHNSHGITNHKVLLNLVFKVFVSPIHSLLISNRLTTIEVARETATIIMLFLWHSSRGRTESSISEPF